MLLSHIRKIKVSFIKSSRPKINTWDTVANTYDNKLSKGSKEIAGFLSHQFKTNHITHQDTILELGSGSGHISAQLAQKKYQVNLLDFSQNALEKSKFLFNKYKLKANFIEEDIFNLDKLNQKFDVIWNSGVMEHFDDKNLKIVFKKIYKKTNKLFIFLVPNPQSLVYLLWRYKLTKEKKWIYGEEHLRKNYDTILNESGFKKVLSTYLGWNFTKDHLKILFENSISSKYLCEMINSKNIPLNEAYLVAYICHK